MCSKIPCGVIQESRIEQLSKDTIWVSDPEKFNDPLDLKLRVKDLLHRSPFDPTDIRVAALQIFNNMQLNSHEKFYDAELVETIKQFLDDAEYLVGNDIELGVIKRIEKYGVVCLTPYWNNQLMWSHYGDSSKGFSLEYAIRAVDDEKWFQSEVEYTTKLPEICLTEVLFTPHQLLDRLLATKAVDWAYEKEFRLIHVDQKHTAVPLPSGIELTAIIAGEKISAGNIAKLKGAAKQLNIPSFKMRKKDYSYELQLEKF